MPRPPFPNAIRAVLGFPIGMILMLLVVTLTRLFFGASLYLPRFWENESTLMFALLGGAFGFLWGAGAVFDFEAYEEQKSLVPVAPRISDPDNPLPSSNPLMALLDAIPAIGYVLFALLISVGWLYLVVSLGRLPVGFTLLALFLIGYLVRYLSGNQAIPSTGILAVMGLLIAMGFGIDAGLVPGFLPSEPVIQTVNQDAAVSQFGEANYSILGLVELKETNQAVLFITFALVVVFGIVGGAAAMGLLFYLLNQMVNTVQGEEAVPLSNDLLPNRLAAFFTEWALDIVNGVGGQFRR